MLHGRDIVLKLARWAVGDGSRIQVREDIWLSTGQKIEKNLPLEVNTVADIIYPSNKNWDIGRI